MSELDAFLERSRAEGTQDSIGTFTLDAERANLLLRTYQLADRSYYLLKLVQAAVLGGASEINFSVKADEVQATIFGRDLNFLDTRDVLRALTETDVLQDHSAMSQLAMALNAALTLKPISIEWTVWNAWRQETLQLNKAGSSLVRLHERPWDSSFPGYRFTLRRPTAEKIPAPPARGWLENLKSLLHARKEEVIQRADEHGTLSGRCTYAPIRVQLDGRPLNGPRLGGDRASAKERGPKHDFEAYVFDGSPNCIALPPVAERYAENLGRCPFATSYLYFLEPETRERFTFTTASAQWNRGAMMLAQPAKGTGLARLFIVHYGILLEIAHVDLGIPGAQVVTSSVGFAIDISQQSIVRNEVFERRVEDIRALFTELASTKQDAFISALAANVEPIFATIDSSYLPQSSGLEADYSPNGSLLSLRREAVRLTFEVPAPSRGAHETCPPALEPIPGRARLEPSDCGWPEHPPEQPSLWVSWVRGAIACVASGGFVRFTRDHLPGYLNPDRDGVRASFYSDGQLRELACYRNGECAGWNLSLSLGNHAGRVTHAREAWDERYEDGSVRNADRPPRKMVWSTWVESWIECVYRDAQL